VQLGRNRSRPRRIVRDVACVRSTGAAHGLGRSQRARRWPSSASPGRRAQRAAALLGEPAVARHRSTKTTGKRWLTGVETAARRDGDGRARRGGGSGDGSARTTGARTRPVGAGAALVRQLSAARASGRDVAASARRGRAGAACGAAVGARRVAARRQRRTATQARRGARRLTSGARCQRFPN
jgi:hypothetical protein